MAESKRLLKVAGGAVAVLAMALVWGPQDDAQAARRKRGRGVLAVETSSVTQRGDVALNEVVELRFTTNVLSSSVGPATVQIRGINATRTGYTKQVFGTYQVFANIVRFFPRLPGHLRDSNGNFFVEGSSKDDAAANAGLQPSTDYLVWIVGRPEVTTVRSTSGRPLRRTTYTTFSTAPSTDPSTLFTTKTYSDSPPPQFAFSNPTDTVPSAATQYATRGGTKGVPNDINVQLYCTRVPLAPASTRVAGNVTLTMLERYGNPDLRRPVRGTPYVEQNFESTLLMYKPRFPLSDRAEYALRVSKNVKDLTEEFDFAPNRERERLRALYEFLSASRASKAPGTPAELLDEPPAALAGDWPSIEQTAARGMLKANILSLGDTYPEEFDPRVMVIFTTRDEPVTNAEFRIDFLRSDGLYDGQLSSGEWDQSVPEAASAVFTAAAGAVTDGDFTPSANVTLPNASYPGPVFNFRNVVIPQGVTVTLTGTQPIVIRGLTFTLNGTIDASGKNGDKGVAWRTNGSNGSSTEYAYGGKGGPGGGDGGSSIYPGTLADWWYGGGSAGNPGNAGPYRSGSGKAGMDDDGGNPTPVGGQGGQGGSAATGSASGYTYSYCYGGGGGGGGGSAKGGDGKNGSWTGSPYSAWNGVGGQGGAAAKVPELVPMFGGSGGGCSGCGGFNLDYSTSVAANGWTSGGAAGGGGGGSVTIQSAKVLNIGSTGVIRSAGGNGGAYYTSGSYGESGGGGGGSGGSILLRSTGGFNIATPSTALQVPGGLGASGGSYSGQGGAGSLGFLRAEDPNGAVSVPLPGLAGTPRYGSLGIFDPIGGGVPSYVYSKWADLGVEDPRILPWSNPDIATDPNVDDAIYVQAQMTREDPANFGSADTSAVDGNQDTTDITVTSQWVPIKVHDRTGLPGSGAFAVPGYDPGSDGQEFSGFPVDELNGHGYRFIRFRIFFRLDSQQRFSDDLPNVDFLVTHYQYNL